MATQFSNQNQFLLALPVGHLESMAKNIRDAFEELYRKSKGENGLTEEEREEKRALVKEYCLLTYTPSSKSRDIFEAWREEDVRKNPQKYDF